MLLLNQLDGLRFLLLKDISIHLMLLLNVAKESGKGLSTKFQYISCCY